MLDVRRIKKHNSEVRFGMTSVQINDHENIRKLVTTVENNNDTSNTPLVHYNLPFLLSSFALDKSQEIKLKQERIINPSFDRDYICAARVSPSR